MRFDAHVLWRAADVLGEGPLWDHRTGQLIWVDIVRGLVHSWSAHAGARELLHLESLIGSMALSGGSDLLLATSSGLLRWSAASGQARLLVNPIAGRSVRFNDGRVDAAGRFWVGTMALDPVRHAEPCGELYRYDPDGRIQRMEDGLTISNGLDWAPDGRTLYLTDTMRRAIYAYDFEPGTGAISNRRILVETAEGDGYPDGLVVDCNGDLWSAAFGGSAICRYDSTGQLLGKITLPVTYPTAMTFGGADGSTAFITSSRHVLAANHNETEAGSVFSVVLQACGRRAAVFGQGHLP